MIVDDDEIVCRIADKILNQKYETFSVNSGEEALEQAEAGQPDLILMDLNMPEMDGYETMEQLKQQSGYDIPVIFMTSEDNIESEVRGLEMGARDYIHKPFKADILLKRIEMVLQNEHTRRVLEKNADELARVLTSEHGKVLSDARGECIRGMEVVEFACGTCQ